MSELDFKGLASRLLSESRDWLPRWFPNGKAVGQEFCIGDIQGNPGDSLKINLNTGKWSDFSTGLVGGDLLSLYAAIRGIKNGEAFKELSGDMPPIIAPPPPLPTTPPPIPTLCAPPEGATAPDMHHAQHGKPSMSWCYKNPHGQPIFYIARYNKVDGKVITPWSWNGSKWACKAWPAPRPLYGLEILSTTIDRPCLIVEGERAADAARLIVGDRYVVMTWPNGSNAVKKAAWEPIYGRRILIWPDADAAGIKAADQIAEILHPHCKEIKIINTDGQPEGWDAADATGWNWPIFQEWAKPRALLYISTPPLRVPEPLPTPPLTPIEQAVIEYPEPSSAQMLWDKLGLALQGNATPYCNAINVIRIIEGTPDYQGIWFDEFHQRYFMSRPDTPVTVTRREWTDSDDSDFMGIIQSRFGLHRISSNIVAEAVRMYARRRTTNEPRDWLDSLTWDGTPRINDFLTACLNANPTDYTLAASRNFWIGLVARIYRPGCQLDNMLVLEGPQGIGKTRALRLIGGPWYAELTASFDNAKEVAEILKGKMLIEISELDAFSRSEVGTIKKLITCPTDRYRVSYGHTAQDHPRTCVFIGTTNDDTYLRDQTGARRFWPIACGGAAGAGGTIEYDFIAKHRDQFFAEAVHAFKSGEPWYIMPGSAAQEQEDRRQVDEWENIIGNYLNTNLFLERVTISQIALDCLKIDPVRLDRQIQMRISNALKVLKFKRYPGYWVRQTLSGPAIGV